MWPDSFMKQTDPRLRHGEAAVGFGHSLMAGRCVTGQGSVSPDTGLALARFCGLFGPQNSWPEGAGQAEPQSPLSS